MLPTMPQELCDEGTLLVAISKAIFGSNRDTSEGRSKLRSLLKTAREVAAGMQHLHALGVIRECDDRSYKGTREL